MTSLFTCWCILFIHLNPASAVGRGLSAPPPTWAGCIWFIHPAFWTAVGQTIVPLLRPCHIPQLIQMMVTSAAKLETSAMTRNSCKRKWELREECPVDLSQQDVDDLQGNVQSGGITDHAWEGSETWYLQAGSLQTVSEQGCVYYPGSSPVNSLVLSFDA